MVPYIVIFTFFICLLIIYLFIIFRLKIINRRHIEHTGIEGIKCAYNKMLIITSIFISILFVIGSIIILTIL